VRRKNASPPASRMVAATRSPPASSTSAIPTLAPSAASARALARPIPKAPPVTTATFPSTRPTLVDLLAACPLIRR
jgi:hypothetical protein